MCLMIACTLRILSTCLFFSTIGIGCKDRPYEPPAPSNAETKSGSTSWVKIPVAKGKLAALISAQAAVAEAGGKKSVVYIGATWCPPCGAIKKYKTDKLMVAAFQGTHIIELDVDDWDADELTALGYEAASIPVFLAVGKDAKTNGKTINGGAWGDNTPANMAPPLTKFFAAL
jgi:thiol-disulfide isomerase/thioredoxin